MENPSNNNPCSEINCNKLYFDIQELYQKEKLSKNPKEKQEIMKRINSLQEKWDKCCNRSRTKE